MVEDLKIAKKPTAAKRKQYTYTYRETTLKDIEITNEIIRGNTTSKMLIKNRKKQSIFGCVIIIKVIQFSASGNYILKVALNLVNSFKMD